MGGHGGTRDNGDADGTRGGRGDKTMDGTAPTDLTGGEAPADLPDGTAPTGDLPSGEAPTDLPDGTAPSDLPDGEAPADAEAAQYAQDGVTRDATSSGLSLDGTYETAQDYIDALNANGEWVTYDEDTGKVSITSVADFVTACKQASKSFGAFDQLDAGQAENTLFGYGDGNGAHFDSILYGLLSESGSEYADAYAADLAKTDAQGNTVDVRANMYNPLYVLLEAYDGYGSATVAQYWRIRTGINQSDTALTTEVNLALALQAYGADVDFATIWGQGHTQAESTGSSDANFIAWVNACVGE